MHDTISRLIRTRARLTQELNRDPTYAEIAQEMDIDVEKVEHIIKINRSPDSLDHAIREGEDESVVGDIIEDVEAVKPEDSTTQQLLKEDIATVLGKALTDREQKIVRMRFGINQQRVHTLEEVGQDLGVTRERIRQIEAKAIKKLKKHKATSKLKDYLS